MNIDKWYRYWIKTNDYEVILYFIWMNFLTERMSLKSQKKSQMIFLNEICLLCSSYFILFYFKCMVVYKAKPNKGERRYDRFLRILGPQLSSWWYVVILLITPPCPIKHHMYFWYLENIVKNLKKIGFIFILCKK